MNIYYYSPHLAPHEIAGSIHRRQRLVVRNRLVKFAEERLEQLAKPGVFRTQNDRLFRKRGWNAWVMAHRTHDKHRRSHFSRFLTSFLSVRHVRRRTGIPSCPGAPHTCRKEPCKYEQPFRADQVSPAASICRQKRKKKFNLTINHATAVNNHNNSHTRTLGHRNHRDEYPQ